MLIVHGAAPTAVSIVPATAVAVTETSHVAWPGMMALKLLRWGLRRSTVDAGARGQVVDGDVRQDATRAVRIAVPGPRGPGRGDRRSRPRGRRAGRVHVGVGPGQGGQVGTVLLLASLGERSAAIDDQADPGHQGDGRQGEQDDDLAALSLTIVARWSDAVHGGPHSHGIWTLLLDVMVTAPKPKKRIGVNGAWTVTLTKSLVVQGRACVMGDPSIRTQS